MAKLIVFDKDGTLVKPKSGGTFVQHPHDQELLPGVAQKLKQLWADGWTMAIASNQGGCAEFEILADEIKPGMIVDLDGEYAKVQEVESTSRNTHILTNLGRSTISGLFNARYKSIDEATEEMRFAMELTGIYQGVFCPDSTASIGENIVHCVILDDQTFRTAPETIESCRHQLGLEVNGFRKPNPGMLQYLADVTVLPKGLTFVGDRPEDQQAAGAAGFQFHWAKDFFCEVANA